MVTALVSVGAGNIGAMDAQPVVGDGQRRIAESFNDYFANFGIAIEPEDVVCGSRRTIRHDSGWVITYRVDPDAAGAVSLEFYATHRRTNDRHARITADGEGEYLEALSEIAFLDSDNSVVEHEDRNAAIAQRLRDRGLYPHPAED